MPGDYGTVLERAAALIGPKYVLTAPSDTALYLRDWRGRYQGAALGVLLPAKTEEVGSLVQLCREMNVSIVPQAGNTGLTGGAVAQGERPSLIINVSRLNRVREVDVLSNSITVEAGCILANVREAADAHGRLFPMLLGSVGSCEIGGLVSTNAGGTGVLRYGNMRELTLGLQVILPSGQIWDGLRALRKDNAGYDLKQLFIGAEGTLGIVTAAVLKLFPRPIATGTAMASLESVQQAVDLLQLMQARIGNRIEAFEIMSKEQIEVVLAYRPNFRSPLELQSPWYVLMEIADSASDWEPHSHLERTLEAALESELIVDAVVAMDDTKARRIWELRHNISEANKHVGFTVSNDTSVPISRLPEFIERVTKRLTDHIEAGQICHCGHVGDGNVHVIVVLSRDVYRTEEQCDRAASVVNLIVHEESVGLGGSISAEHGIGTMHVARLERFKPALDLAMMRSIKASFDPDNLMNPGKIFRMT